MLDQRFPAPVRRSHGAPHAVPALAAAATAAAVVDRGVGGGLAYRLQRSHHKHATGQPLTAESSVPTGLFSFAARAVRTRCRARPERSVGTGGAIESSRREAP